MAKTYDILKQQADAIRTEVNLGANSSERIGGMFDDLIEFVRDNSSEQPLDDVLGGGGADESEFEPNEVLGGGGAADF